MNKNFKLFPLFGALVLGMAAVPAIKVVSQQPIIVTKAEGEMTPISVNLTQVQLRWTGTDYRMLVGFGTGWSNEGAVNNAELIGLSNFNTMSKIVLEFKDGTKKALSEISANADKYFQKLWGEEKFATYPFKNTLTKTEMADLQRVEIQEGCEFPKLGSTTEKYVVDKAYVCANTNGVSGDGHIIFNYGDNLLSVTNRGTMSIFGLGDPGKVDDGKDCLWIRSNVEEWVTAAANTNVSWAGNIAANYTTNILLDGKTIGSYRAETKRYAWGLGSDGNGFIHKWARAGNNFAFGVNGISDFSAFKEIVIPAGTTFPGVKNCSSLTTTDYDVWTTDVTYKFVKSGTETWRFALADVSGENVAEGKVKNFNWAKFGNGNVWAMYGVEGVDKVDANIKTVDSINGAWNDALWTSLDLTNKVYIDGARPTKNHVNFGIGGYSADDIALHYTYTIDEVNALSTFVIQKGTMIPKAAVLGQGDATNNIGWIKVSEDAVAINRNGEWQLASVAYATPRSSFMYVDNQTKVIEKDTSDVAFYLDGVGPEVKTGDANAVGLHANALGQKLMASANYIDHVLLDGQKANSIPESYVNWWGRGGNYFGLAMTMAAPLTTIEHMTVKAGLWVPTAKTIAGEENKIIMVDADKEFTYANTTSKYQEVHTVDSFDQFLVDYIGTECNFAAADGYNYDAAKFSNIWKYAKRVYAALSDADKTTLKTSTGAGVTTYDYLVAKYSLENFLDRTIDSSNFMTVASSNVDSIVIISSVLVMLTVAGFIMLKKKKHN